jgi:ribosomal protein S18
MKNRQTRKKNLTPEQFRKRIARGFGTKQHLQSEYKKPNILKKYRTEPKEKV